MNKSDYHSKTTFVLKNGENALEFTNRRSMLAYYKRFISLFPDVPTSNLAMYKIQVYQLNLPEHE